MIEAERRGQKPAIDGALVAVLRAALAGAERDPAFAAELLTLPGESFLADQLETVDVDAIHAAREAARAAIGRDLAAEFAALYERLADSGPYTHRRHGDRAAQTAQHGARLSRGRWRRGGHRARQGSNSRRAAT